MLKGSKKNEVNQRAPSHHLTADLAKKYICAERASHSKGRKTRSSFYSLSNLRTRDHTRGRAVQSVQMNVFIMERKEHHIFTHITDRRVSERDGEKGKRRNATLTRSLGRFIFPTLSLFTRFISFSYTRFLFEYVRCRFAIS